MFLSFIGWISLDDIRLGLEYTDTERFSSLLGIVLLIFSLIFPFIVCGTLIKNFRPIMPALDFMTLEEYKKNGTLESWKLKHHTPKQREEYFERYGSLLADFRLDSQTIGIYKVVTYKFLQLLSELFVVIMVTQMRRLETTAVLLIMSFNLVQLGYLI